MENKDQSITSKESIGPPPSPTGEDLTGKVVGDFRLLRRLGQGGMGQVYLAEQISLKRKVALKLLRFELAANERALQRFKAEAEAVARATHANIVQVYAIGEDNGLHFMALEYVEGRNLREYLEKKGPPELLVSLSILRQVASALQRAGELGIIHRDIKPENILVTRKGEAKVADFGLSRIFAEDHAKLNLTQTGITMGTPLYMSPEQVEGKPVDPRTDIYSLGVTAYHLLSGQPPFRGQTAFEVAVQHVQRDPEPLHHLRPDIPEELSNLVHRMIAKRPEDRCQTAQEIVRELSRLRDNLVGVTGSQTVSSPPFSRQTPIPAPLSNSQLTYVQHTSKGRKWMAWAFMGGVLLVLVGGVVLGRLSSLRNQAVANDINSNQLPSEEAEEQKLVEAFKRFENAEGLHELRRGMDACIDLGLFYLRQRRLNEANRFFKELDRNEQKQFQLFGKLGQAMVLAFEDQPAESNQLFRKIFLDRITPKKSPLAKLFWLGNPELRKMVSEALEHNFANDPQHFPPPLEALRQPPSPVIGPPANKGKRPAGKA